MSVLRSLKWHIGLLILITMLTAWVYQGADSKLSQSDSQYFLDKITAQIGNPGKHNLRELADFVASDSGKPFYTVNLYGFHKTAQYPTKESSLSGEGAFSLFSDVMLKLMAKQGAHPIFSSTKIMQSQHGWDRLVIVRYPSRRALLEIFSDPKFIEASADKWAAIKKHQRFTVEAIHLPDLKIIWFISSLIIVFLAVLKIRAQSSDN